MDSPHTQLQLTDARPGGIRTDALVLASCEGAQTATLCAGHGLPRAAAGAVEQTLSAVGAKGHTDEVIRLSSVDGVKAALVVVVGTGPAPTAVRGPQRPDARETLRRAAGVGARALAGTADAVFALGASSAETVSAVAEGALLGGYSFQTFYGAGKAAGAKAPLRTAHVHGLTARSAEGKTVIAKVEAVTSAVRYARDLVNTPPNVLYPESFAESVSRRAAEGAGKVKVEVWDVSRLQTEGCGGVLGVGLGSARGPRLVTMTYAPSRPQAKLAFVGKGITFDSGGLCLKPGAAMVTMKCDMGGAAAVAGAVLALAELKVPVAVTGYLCLAENMTGDLAQRPGDVVVMRGGTSVEIINTDAEGRLVMADGLALASEQAPDAIIDIATLTGAAVVALGERTLGVMGNDEELVDRIRTGAGAVGEPAWPLPLLEELRPTMDSPVADLKHTGDKSAGAMVAATFLAEFVGKDSDGQQLPWAHLDIAGPAFNDKSAFGYTPAGGTGAGVRTLVELARSYTR